MRAFHTLYHINFICNCMYNRYIDEGVKVKQKTLVNFQWQVAIAGFSETQIIQTRCDVACDRTVPTPKHWETAIKCSSLHAKAKAAAEGVREHAEQVHCAFLGLPKTFDVPIAGTLNTPGAVVRLQTSTGARQDYAPGLCTSTRPTCRGTICSAVLP